MIRPQGAYMSMDASEGAGGRPPTRRTIKIKYALCAIPASCGLISTALYFLQHGFGAGHGKFDFFIALLGAPFTLLWLFFPSWSPELPEFLNQSDLLLLIWLPVFVNTMIFFLIGAAIEYVRRPGGPA